MNNNNKKTPAVWLASQQFLDLIEYFEEKYWLYYLSGIEHEVLVTVSARIGAAETWMQSELHVPGSPFNGILEIVKCYRK